MEKTKTKLSGPLTRNLQKDDILCLAGDKESDLYIIHSGKLMVCVSDGSKVTPLAYLGAGEYLGELSFFDGSPRSAHVICVEECDLIQIPVTEIQKQFPKWLSTLAQYMTKQIRQYDGVIAKQGIRRQNAQTIAALDHEEQRHILNLIENRGQN